MAMSTKANKNFEIKLEFQGCVDDFVIIYRLGPGVDRERCTTLWT